MPKIYNKHHGNVPASAVYVGRPTKWGNPFTIGRHGERDEVISLFEQWVMLPEQAHLREAAKIELRGKDLVCFCAPKPCHADVWMRIANEPQRTGPPQETD